MSDEETFYDSLEEDNNEKENSNLTIPLLEFPIKTVHPEQIGDEEENFFTSKNGTQTVSPLEENLENEEFFFDVVPAIKSKIPQRRNKNNQNHLKKEYFFDASSNQDLSDSIPLYNGEISKSKLSQTKKKKIEKTQKLIPCLVRPQQKSYLMMYYEKKKQLAKISDTIESTTARAECGKLSPDRHSQLETDLAEVKDHPRNENDSEEEEFYENFLALDLENKTSSPVSLLNEKKSECSKFSSCSSLNIKSSSDRPFYVTYNMDEANEKLELLKKRQTYGTKMSMKNRIRIEELKSLKKIKDFS